MRIGGEKITRAEIIEVFNPYTRELVGTVPKATVDDVRHAFEYAHAYRARLTRYERAQILRRAADIADAMQASYFFGAALLGANRTVKTKFFGFVEATVGMRHRF